MADSETKSVEKLSSNDELHKIFHSVALKKSNVLKVRELIKTGVKPCYQNKIENCYILAQKNLNPDFLKMLVEHDSSGVNTVYENGDSLLMRDIARFESRHFQLLTNHGADVNHCNQDGYTALHYATMNKVTPIYVIKKLIELKADVNKAVEKKNNDGNETTKDKWYANAILADSCDGDTPLINVINCCYDYSNGFKKVKLLVESGADVNLANGFLETPLLLAAGIYTIFSDAEDLIKLMKYLLDNGAKARFIENDNVNAISYLIWELQNIVSTDILSKNETSIEEYFIPAVELLMEAGYDLFLRTRSRSDSNKVNIMYSPLFSLLNESRDLCIQCTNGHKLILHVVNLAFKKLNDSSFKFDNELQQHPIECILQNLRCFTFDKNLHPSILNMVFSDQVEEFKKYSMDYCGLSVAETQYLHPSILNMVVSGQMEELKNYNMTYYGRSVAEAFVEALPITEIKQWLVKLYELNIDVNRKTPLISILLRRFLSETNDEEQLKGIIDYLLEQKYDVCKPTQWPEGYFTQETADFIKTSNIPFCVWKSAQFFKVEVLKKFLPFWNEPPLAVLLYLKMRMLSYSDSGETPAAKDFEKLVLFLCEYGGPLSHGTMLYNEMKKYIDSCRFPKVVTLLTELHASPASLKVLCRTVIRSNAVGHGNNLPGYLASLVPSAGLKKFLTCDFS